MRLVATTDEGKVVGVLASVEGLAPKRIREWVEKCWVKDRKRQAKELSTQTNGER
jgi:hypothetical protein